MSLSLSLSLSLTHDQRQASLVHRKDIFKDDGRVTDKEGQNKRQFLGGPRRNIRRRDDASRRCGGFGV